MVQIRAKDGGYCYLIITSPLSKPVLRLLKTIYYVSKAIDDIGLNQNCSIFKL